MTYYANDRAYIIHWKEQGKSFESCNLDQVKAGHDIGSTSTFTEEMRVSRLLGYGYRYCRRCFKDEHSTSGSFPSGEYP